MSTSLLEISTTLQNSMRFQKTPVTLTSNDYLDLAKDGCMRFYTDIGISDKWNIEFVNGATPTVTRNLSITEMEYVLVASQISFFYWIRMAWNTLISYTTNALSVANANKPFEQISKSIDELESRLTEIFYKITSQSQYQIPNTLTSQGVGT